MFFGKEEEFYAELLVVICDFVLAVRDDFDKNRGCLLYLYKF